MLYVSLFLILDIHATQEVVGNDVETVGILVCASRSMVAYTAYEAAAHDDNVHRLGHKELDAATEGVDLYLLIFGNGGISQVHTDSATESVETGTMERLATIDILVAAVAHAATDTLAVFTDGQRTLQPLVRVATIAVDNQPHTYIYQQADEEISHP